MRIMGLLGILLGFACDVHGEAVGRLAAKFRVKLLAIDTNEGCDVGDVNQDGHLDVVAGRNWYAGPDYLSRPVRSIEEFGGDYSESNGEHLFDINNDGRLDVVAGSFIPTEVYWYENPGSAGLADGKLWKRHLLVNTGFSTNEMNWFRDMDGDKVPDFVVNGWDPNVRMAYWLLKPGNAGKEPEARGIIVGTKNGHGQGFGDVNGDGREDIVFGSGWYERPADGNRGAWPLHEDFQLPHASCPILVRDMDGDGRNDLVWGNGHGYGLYFHRQLAPKADGTTQWEPRVVDEEWSQAHAMIWADLDGDGEDELVTGKRVRAHPAGDPGVGDPAVLYAYQWNRETKAFDRTLIAHGVGTGLQIRTADMDKNGRIDIIAAGKDGTKIVFNDGKSDK